MPKKQEVSQIDDLIAEGMRLQQERDALLKQLEAAREDKQRLAYKLELAAQEAQNLREDLADVKFSLNARENKLDETENECDALAKELDALKALHEKCGEEFEGQEGVLEEAHNEGRRKLYALASAVLAVLPPESLDESWEVSRARSLLRDALDEGRTTQATKDPHHPKWRKTTFARMNDAACVGTNGALMGLLRFNEFIR